MARFQKMTILICLVAMFAASGPADAGLFCRKARCRWRCHVPADACRGPCPSGYICPLYNTQQGPGTCLWYAEICFGNYGPWYAACNHGPGSCYSCNNCDSGRKKYISGGSDFYVSAKVEEDGVQKSAPLEKKDFGADELSIEGFQSWIVTVTYTRDSAPATILVQIIELTMRDKSTQNKCHVKFALEVSSGTATEKLPKKPHSGGQHVFFVDHGGKEVVVLTDGSTVSDPGT